MIGKKAAIGIIAATGVVAVGVPVGIVVGQHASKTGSLDSKMQSKWSDIEKELASSFGGFEIRDRDDVLARQTAQSDSATQLQSKQALLNRVTGANVPEYDPNDNEGKTAFFNSLTAERKKLDGYVNNIIEVMQSAGSQAANLTYKFDSASSEIKMKENTSGINITLSTQRDGSKIMVSSITFINVEGKGSSTIVIPQDFKAFIDKETNADLIAKGQTVKIAFDMASVKKFIYSGASKFKNALDGAIDGSITLNVEQSAIDMLAEITADDSRLNHWATNANAGQTLAGAFGFRKFIEAIQADLASHPSNDFSVENVAALVAKIDSTVEGCKETFEETKYSIEGHHDKATIEKYKANLKSYSDTDVDKNGLLFKPFYDTVISPIDKGDHANVDPELASLFPADALDVSLFFALSIKNNAKEPLPDYDSNAKIMDGYIDSWNRGNPGTMFTNAEAKKWQWESGNATELMMNPDGTGLYVPAPGEKLADLGSKVRELKIRNVDATDWLIRQQYQLVWNRDKFNSIINKYNLSINDLYIDLDTNGYKQFISSNANSKFTFDNVFNTELKNTTGQKPLNYLYPLASSEWVGTGYRIALNSQTANTWEPKALEENAMKEFRITQDTKITFRLRIENSDINKIYDNNSKPFTFTLSKDGELSIDSTIKGNA